MRKKALLKVTANEFDIEGTLCLLDIDLEYVISENYECFVTGYGLQNEQPETFDGNLHEAEINITDWETCQNTNIEMSLNSHHEEKFFCAGTPGVKDSCKGDSGKKSKIFYFFSFAYSFHIFNRTSIASVKFIFRRTLAVSEKQSVALVFNWFSLIWTRTMRFRLWCLLKCSKICSMDNKEIGNPICKS